MVSISDKLERRGGRGEEVFEWGGRGCRLGRRRKIASQPGDGQVFVIVNEGCYKVT